MFIAVMPFQATLAALLLAALPLTGCLARGEGDDPEELDADVTEAGDEQEESIGVDSQPIVGGTKDKVTRSVVAISVWNQQTSRTCSGTIVAPHVVLTAAHCLAPGDVGSNNVVQVFMGDSLSSPWPWLFKSVKEFHIHPAYKPGLYTLGSDFAVVITKGALGRPPIPMNRIALKGADVGAPLRFVGFGQTDPNDPSSTGQRFQTTLSITSVLTNLIGSSGKSSSTCRGDSGGPGLLLRNGVEYVAGVNSYGSISCTNWNYSGRVDVVAASFVDPYIKKFDPNFKPM